MTSRVEFDRELPLSDIERDVRRHNVPRTGKQQGDGELSRAYDIRGRGVDDHDPDRGRCLHVNVVQADTGTGHHFQSTFASSESFRVDLGCRADQHRVGFRQSWQQGGAIGPVNVTDLEVRTKSINCRRRQFLGDQDDGAGGAGVQH